MIKRLIDGLTLREFAEKYNHSLDNVRKRYSRAWSVEEQILGKRERGYYVMINGKKKRLIDLVQAMGISHNVALDRLKNYSRPEDAIRTSKDHRIVKKCNT